MEKGRKDVSVKMTADATATLLALLRIMEEILTKPKEEATRPELIEYWCEVLAALDEARRDLERAFGKAGYTWAEQARRNDGKEEDRP